VHAHHTALAVLTAGALTLGAAGTATAKAATCKPPRTGYQSCLRVLYKPRATGIAKQVRVTATVVHTVDACPHRIARRTVVITRDGEELARVRRAGHCAKRVVTWRARFPAARTGAWALRTGDTVTAAWSGVRRTSSVEIQPG
jgi:hypothetical protein